MADAKAMRDFIDAGGQRPATGTTLKMLAALRRWHRRDTWSRLQYAFFEELAVGPGRGQQRMDAWAITGRGGTVTGYELKASRSDAMRELHDLTKMQALLALCHRAYMVIPGGSPIVTPDELPWEMGLIAVALDDHGRLSFVKHAPHREIAEPTWDFVATLALHKVGGASV